VRRAERLIRVTQRLVDHPNHAVSLSDLADELGSAKSSLSEDVAIIREVLTAQGTAVVETLAGANGGVRYRPRVPQAVRDRFVTEMAERLADPSRLLPGGFLYMSDVLGDPDVLETAGRLFAEPFYDAGVNVVVTMETKGIPLAVATARCLHVPVVIVRREHRVTDGPALSLHYVSGSERRIQTMSISTRAMPAHARALIVDDFMRAGATVKAVRGLLAEFSAEVVGTAVFVATDQPQKKLVDSYLSLFRLGTLEEGKRIEVVPSEFVSQGVTGQESVCQGGIMG
jgi:purine operon repressor